MPKTCSSGLDDACDGLPCVVWAHGYGPSTMSQEINAVTLDPTDGSLVVTGDFQGTITFGGTTLTSTSPPNNNVFVARITSDGTPVWAKAFDPSRGLAVAVDGTGNVFVGGKSDYATTVGTTSLPNGQFVIKLDKTGALQWARCIGDTKMTFGSNYLRGMSSMVVAPDGDIIVAGTVSYPPLDFGDGPLQGENAYVAKLSSVDGAGTKATTGLRWAQLLSWQAGTSNSVTAGPKVGVDAKGQVYVGTMFTGTVQIGGEPATSSSGGTDISLTMFTPTGQWLGATNMGNGLVQTLDSIAVNAFGIVALAGQLQGTLTFSNPAGTISAKSTAGDSFVLQMNPGNPDPGFGWGTPFGVNGETVDVGFDSSGNVRAAGWFTGTLDLGVGALAAGANRMMLLLELSGTTGSVKWNRGWPYPSTNTFIRAVVAPSGDSFVGGRLDKGPFDLGTGALIQPTDAVTSWAGRFGP